MSLIGDRQAIADALSTVTDVTGYPFEPVAIKAGDAWPHLDSLERSDGRVFLPRWLVYVALPADEKSAAAWVDSHYEAIVDGLLDVGFIERIDPPGFRANQNVLMITMGD
jgi:hypothetical protein